MSEHAPPPYAYPPAPSPATRPPRGRGFAVAALVLGILALLGAWVPVVNLGAGVMALIGVVLGTVGLSRARKGLADGTAMARVGVALGAASLVVVVVMNVLFAGDVVRSFRKGYEEGYSTTANSTTPGGAVPVDPTPVDPTPVDPTRVDPTPVDPAPSATDAPAAALALGTPAQIGDYSVTVTGVTQDADAAVAAFDDANPPPAGRYVTVDFSVRYDGDLEGDPFFDLSADFLGTDSRNYSDADCQAVIANDGLDVPTLRRGGTADYSICFDVPAEVIAGGDVQVADLYAGDAVAVVWDAP